MQVKLNSATNRHKNTAGLAKSNACDRESHNRRHDSVSATSDDQLTQNKNGSHQLLQLPVKKHRPTNGSSHQSQAAVQASVGKKAQATSTNNVCQESGNHGRSQQSKSGGRKTASASQTTGCKTIKSGRKPSQSKEQKSAQTAASQISSSAQGKSLRVKKFARVPEEEEEEDSAEESQSVENDGQCIATGSESLCNKQSVQWPSSPRDTWNDSYNNSDEDDSDSGECAKNARERLGNAALRQNETNQVRKESSAQQSRRNSAQGQTYTVRRSSLLESVDHESEYNIINSCDSTPEHKIHTVVGHSFQQSRKLATASQFRTDLPSTSAATKTMQIENHQDGSIKFTTDAAMLERVNELDYTDSAGSSCTPKTPNTNAFATSENAHKNACANDEDDDNDDKDGAFVEGSSSYDIAQFTNGNMADLLEDDNQAAMKKDKQEFMYAFDGAMSVIQETDEPDDEMTIKNSAMSSRMQFARLDSLVTPIEQLTSKEPSRQKLHQFQVNSQKQQRQPGQRLQQPKLYNPSSNQNQTNQSSVFEATTISAANGNQLLTMAQMNSKTAASSSQLLAEGRTLRKDSSVSLQAEEEDTLHQLTATMDSLEEPNPLRPLVICNQNNAQQPKLMQNCVENASNMLKLFDLTKNNLQQNELKFPQNEEKQLLGQPKSESKPQPQQLLNSPTAAQVGSPKASGGQTTKSSGKTRNSSSKKHKKSAATGGNKQLKSYLQKQQAMMKVNAVVAPTEQTINGDQKLESQFRLPFSQHRADQSEALQEKGSNSSRMLDHQESHPEPLGEPMIARDAAAAAVAVNDLQIQQSRHEPPQPNRQLSASRDVYRSPNNDNQLANRINTTWSPQQCALTLTGSKRYEDRHEFSQLISDQLQQVSHEQNIVIFDEKPDGADDASGCSRSAVVATVQQYECRPDQEQKNKKMVLTPRQPTGHLLNDMLDQVLGSSQADSAAHRPVVNYTQIIHEKQLQSINKSINNLKDDIRNLSISVYKEVKAQNALVVQSGEQFEDKLDCEFLERIMHVYAFFTSCLNLIAQNDKEAHKLLILQPMILKHITELKQDQVNIQISQNDFFVNNNVKDQTLSTICQNSFDTSNASFNNTMLNQMLSPSRQNTIANCGRGPGVLSAPQKLSYLRTLLQIADQVLQLNGMKHRLIIDSQMSQQQVSEVFSPSRTTTRQVRQQPSLAPHVGERLPSEVGPLFTPEQQLASGASQSREPQFSSPRSQANFKQPSIGQNGSDANSDVYYHKPEKQVQARRESSNCFSTGRAQAKFSSEEAISGVGHLLVNSSANESNQVMVTPVRRDYHDTNGCLTIKDEDNQGSTALETTKGETLASCQTSPGEVHTKMGNKHGRRHRSLGQLSSPRLTKTTTPGTAFVYHPQSQVQHQQQQNSWQSNQLSPKQHAWQHHQRKNGGPMSDPGGSAASQAPRVKSQTLPLEQQLGSLQEPSTTELKQQVADMYFSTLPSSPKLAKCVKSAHRRSSGEGIKEMQLANRPTSQHQNVCIDQGDLVRALQLERLKAAGKCLLVPEAHERGTQKLNQSRGSFPKAHKAKNASNVSSAERPSTQDDTARYLSTSNPANGYLQTSGFGVMNSSGGSRDAHEAYRQFQQFAEHPMTARSQHQKSKTLSMVTSTATTNTTANHNLSSQQLLQHIALSPKRSSQNNVVNNPTSFISTTSIKDTAGGAESFISQMTPQALKQPNQAAYAVAQQSDPHVFFHPSAPLRYTEEEHDGVKNHRGEGMYRSGEPVREESGWPVTNGSDLLKRRNSTLQIELSCDKVELDDQGHVILTPASRQGTDLSPDRGKSAHKQQPSEQSLKHKQTDANQKARQRSPGNNHPESLKVSTACNSSKACAQVTVTSPASSKKVKTINQSSKTTDRQAHQQKSKALKTSVASNDQLIQHGLQAILMKMNTGSLSPRRTCSNQQQLIAPVQAVQAFNSPSAVSHSSKLKAQQPVSRNANQSLTKRSRTNKTQVVQNNATYDSISDNDVSGLSNATTEKFEAHAASRQHSNGTNQLVQHPSVIRQAKRSRNKRKQLAGSSSFLASLNTITKSATVVTVQSNNNEPSSFLRQQLTQTRIEKKPSNSGHYNLIEADSKIRKALKGVISSSSTHQETNALDPANKQQTTTTARNVKSPHRITQQSLKRHNSTKLLTSQCSQLSASGAVSTTGWLGTNNTLQPQKLTSPIKRKSARTLTSQWPSQPQISTLADNATAACAGNHSQISNAQQTSQMTAATMASSTASKKKYTVLGQAKTSNYLLKQEINLNTDKLMGMVNQQAAIQHADRKHLKTGTLSPSNKSLSQAFDAVAKAISRKQSQSNTQQTTRIMTHKNSIVSSTK